MAKQAESLIWDCIAKMAMLLLDDDGGSSRNEVVGKDDVAEVEPACQNWQVAGRSLAAMR